MLQNLSDPQEDSSHRECFVSRHVIDMFGELQMDGVNWGHAEADEGQGTQGMGCKRDEEMDEKMREEE